jgi:hypothetical protein
VLVHGLIGTLYVVAWLYAHRHPVPNGAVSQPRFRIWPVTASTIQTMARSSVETTAAPAYLPGLHEIFSHRPAQLVASERSRAGVSNLRPPRRLQIEHGHVVGSCPERRRGTPSSGEKTVIV